MLINFYVATGWYDVILLPTNECRWNFKEGDVAVLSTPRPGTGLFTFLRSTNKKIRIKLYLTKISWLILLKESYRKKYSNLSRFFSLQK